LIERIHKREEITEPERDYRESRDADYPWPGHGEDARARGGELRRPIVLVKTLSSCISTSVVLM
jgi:hypothetical protein